VYNSDRNFPKGVMMKKIVLIALLGVAALGARDIGFYTGLGTSAFQKNDKNIKGVQPSDELVGGGWFGGDVRFGAHISQVVPNLDLKAYALFYGKERSNSEIGGGIGVEAEYQPFPFKKLGFTAGLEIRGGVQDTEWDEKTVSSKVSAGSTRRHTRLEDGPSTIEFTESTTVSSSSLSLGAAYHFTKNISVDLAYVLRYESYDVEYRDNANKGNRAHLEWSEYKNGVRAGVNFYF
jgi:opacity protein-like surface antigen